jgi:hypothetical protein
MNPSISYISYIVSENIEFPLNLKTQTKDGSTQGSMRIDYTLKWQEEDSNSLMLFNYEEIAE